MNSECLRIADQLRRAIAGDAWHGPPLRDLLAGVTQEQARLRPMPSAHSIHELVVHIEIYLRVAADAIGGTPLPGMFETGEDWKEGGSDWAAVNQKLFASSERLAQAIESFSDERLTETAPGRDYSFYYLFHGVIQHSLYHGGQIALLKKAARTT